MIPPIDDEAEPESDSDKEDSNEEKAEDGLSEEAVSHQETCQANRYFPKQRFDIRTL